MNYVPTLEGNRQVAKQGDYLWVLRPQRIWGTPISLCNWERPGKSKPAPGCSQNLRLSINSENHWPPQRPIQHFACNPTDRSARFRPETGGWRLEAGDWRLETGGWRLETGGEMSSLWPNASGLMPTASRLPKELPMSSPKSVEKMSPVEIRTELVSLLADGVLRYLAKRKVDRGHHQPQFSVESVEGALEVSSKPWLSVLTGERPEC